MRIAALTIAALLTSASLAAAQGSMRLDHSLPSNEPPAILKKVNIEGHLNAQLPLDSTFRDDTGRTVKLRDLLHEGRPVIFAPVYYECPMLCTQVLNGTVSALGVLNFNAGREFDVVAVSINPKETPALAAQKKQAYVERYKRPQGAAGWHFLTGKEENIQKLAAAVGFRYAYDEEIQQYAHGAGIEILTPRGVISKYFYGIEFSPRDLKFGLIEASEERIGTVIDDALLLCYHYDPATGKYGASVIDAVRIGGIATLLALVSFVSISLRRERRSSHSNASV
jgi:protein SCO1